MDNLRNRNIAKNKKSFHGPSLTPTNGKDGGENSWINLVNHNTKVKMSDRKLFDEVFIKK